MYMRHSKNVIRYRIEPETTSWEVIVGVLAVDGMATLINDCNKKMEKAVDNQGLDYVNVFALLSETIELKARMSYFEASLVAVSKETLN